MTEAWPWILSVISAVACLAMARKKRWGWLIGLGNQVLWTIYSVTTRQWGFLLSVTLFTSVYSYGWYFWGKDTEKKPLS